MEISELKLAAYLDDAGDDLKSACETLKKHKINYVVLRHTWAGHICDAEDSVCANLRSVLVKNNLSVVGIISDLGKAPVPQLAKTPEDKLNRVFNLAQYFGASQIRFGIGLKSKETQIGELINQWMQKITERCLTSNILPVWEVSDDSVMNRPSEVASILAKHRRWKLLFDPVQFILKQRQEPFVRYWTLLKSSVASIDLRDFKVGVGYKPIGFGDGQLKLLVNDAVKSAFPGWYFLEPTLGRKHGNAVTRQGTFDLAMEALRVVLS